jgi:hypothetical protein
MADLGSPKLIRKVLIGNGSVNSYTGYHYCAGSRLEWSNGNGVWTSVYTVPYVSSTVVFEVSGDQTARYWRLIKDSDIMVASELSFQGGEPTAPTELSVVQGSGGGLGASGTLYNICADAPPSGQLFSGWVIDSGAGSFFDSTIPLAQFTLGSTSAVVRATYTQNLAPTASISGPASIWVGSEGIWTYSATDANGNLQSWSVRLLPNLASPVSIAGTDQTGAFAHTFSTPGTYTFRLDVTDAMGVTTTANAVVEVRENIPPTIPTSLSVTPTSSTSFNFSWGNSTDASGIAGYEVRVNGGLIESITTQYHTFAGLPIGSAFVAEVRAVDNAQNRSAWAQRSGTLPASDTTPPTAPTLTAHEVYDTLAYCSFVGSTDNVQIAGFEFRTNEGQVTYESWWGAGSNPIGHYYYDLVPGTTNTLKVRAVDSSGNRSPWASVSVATSGEPPPGDLTEWYNDMSVLGLSGPSVDSSNASQLKVTRPKP